jgi:hypothetical protein
MRRVMFSGKCSWCQLLHILLFTHFASFVCHSTVVHWNYLYAFVQEVAGLKVRDVYGAAFVISQLLLMI